MVLPTLIGNRHVQPQCDLPPRLSLRQIVRGTVYAQLRRVRYRI
ncbi:hypothetical protein [Breoghania sp.]|nr:hypothetical protein [Breoghania sp.]MDJ0930984.1 hypothetical protein [Breoghania sp.]